MNSIQEDIEKEELQKDIEKLKECKEQIIAQFEEQVKESGKKLIKSMGESYEQRRI